MRDDEHGAPNLDAMSIEDLMSFWYETNSVRPVAVAKRLFGTASNGRTKATKLLGCYACNKATAMRCRLNGKINIALSYEDICDRIYEDLPAFARW